MKIISHRGNIFGAESDLENTPFFIERALLMKYDVEIDVWLVDKEFYLGHDNPDHKINFSFLKQKGLWIHCKNIECMEALYGELSITYFFHQTDDVSLVSNGLLWTYPGKKITNISIAVLPETVQDWDTSSAIAICTDYACNYKTHGTYK
jgi:hypothetical protein